VIDRPGVRLDDRRDAVEDVPRLISRNVDDLTVSAAPATPVGGGRLTGGRAARTRSDRAGGSGSSLRALPTRHSDSGHTVTTDNRAGRHRGAHRHGLAARRDAPATQRSRDPTHTAGTWAHPGSQAEKSPSPDHGTRHGTSGRQRHSGRRWSRHPGTGQRARRRVQRYDTREVRAACTRATCRWTGLDVGGNTAVTQARRRRRMRHLHRDGGRLEAGQTGAAGGTSSVPARRSTATRIRADSISACSSGRHVDGITEVEQAGRLDLGAVVGDGRLGLAHCLASLVVVLVLRLVRPAWDEVAGGFLSQLHEGADLHLGGADRLDDAAEARSGVFRAREGLLHGGCEALHVPQVDLRRAVVLRGPDRCEVLFRLEQAAVLVADVLAEGVPGQHAVRAGAGVLVLDHVPDGGEVVRLPVAAGHHTAPSAIARLASVIAPLSRVCTWRWAASELMSARAKSRAICSATSARMPAASWYALRLA